MKRFLYIIFALFTVLTVAGCKEEPAKKLIMATSADFPPYEFVNGRKIDGIDPAIIRIIAEKLNCELQIQNMNFDSVITAVQSGKADIAASGLTITDERKKLINFTVPYVIAQQKTVVKEKSPIKNFDDLKGKRIGVQHGTTGDLYVSKNISKPERFASGALAIAAMRAGKVDAVVIDSEPANVFVKQNKDLRLLPGALTSEEYAFAVNKKNIVLLAQINAHLLEMQQSGEIAEIVKRYKEHHQDKTQDIVASNDSFWGNFKELFHINFIKDKRYLYLWHGFLNTLYITFVALLLGIIIGFSVAVIRSTADQTGSLKLLNFLCKVYLTVIRGTPAVVQLLIIYFVIFGSVDISKMIVAIIAFGINSGAYVAEIIRGGIMSIDKGQMEAGRSLGLSYAQTMRLVILPQAFKNVLPALGNEFIVLLKETSIAGYIALEDLTKAGDIIRSQTYDAFMPLAAVALIYLALVMLLSSLLTRLEKRLKKNE